MGHVACEGSGHDLVAWAGGRTAPEEAVRDAAPTALVLNAIGDEVTIDEAWTAPLVAGDGGADALFGVLLADAVQRRIVTGRTPLRGQDLSPLLA